MSRFDYLVIWDEGSEPTLGEIERIKRNTGLTACWRAGRLNLFANIPDAVLADGDKSPFILGTLFEGVAPARRCRALSREVRTELKGSGAAALSRHYWGAYVSVAIGEDASTLHVFRDPSGQQACFYKHGDGQLLLSSRADLLQKADGCRLICSRDAMLDHILWPMIRAEQTALSDVMELLPGHELHAGPAGLECASRWSPWSFIADRDATGRDPRHLADMLRELIVGCVDALASQATKALLAVSGGLDSSIVAAALARSKREFLCVTLATDDAAGDERIFARILARHLRVELVEAWETLDAIDLVCSEAHHLPRPVARSFAQSGDRVQQVLARERGIDLFLTGGGGDNVFCYLHSAAPVADRLIAAGLGMGALTTARDVATLTGVALPSVLRGGWAKMKMAGKPYPWPVRAEFVPPDLVEGRTPPAHPWRVPPAGTPPGKVMHVAWLLAIQNHLEGYGREALHPLRAPLMAQPIVEFCLAIPSWQWCKDGRDRSLARQAFADLLPPEILGRRSKGTPTSFVMQIVEERRTEIRELLLGGVLANVGLIDRAPLDAFLRNPDPRQVNHYMQTMAMVDVEAWARAWG